MRYRDSLTATDFGQSNLPNSEVVSNKYSALLVIEAMLVSDHSQIKSRLEHYVVNERVNVCDNVLLTIRMLN